MRQTQSQNIFDDLPLTTLVQGITEQSAWLQKTATGPDLRFGPRTVARTAYAHALDDLAAFLATGPAAKDLQSYIDARFDWYEVYGDEGWGQVKLTSYYLPRVNGSKVKTDVYTEPFLRRPDDLIQIMTAKYWEPVKEIGTMRGRLDPSDLRRVLPYYSRTEINSGLLSAKGLELVWADPIDVFVTHIQGSGTVLLDSGEEIRLGYADQNGHPYVAIGKFLLDQIPLEQMSMQRIEDHLRTLPPAELHAFLEQNPSYVFFRQLEGEATTANTTQVVDGRTIATDTKFFPKGALGLLAFAKPESVSPEGATSPVGRLVIDQDTGGAIKGPGRVDLFWGKGNAAGRIAGTINQSAKLFYLVPRLDSSIDPADSGP